jgi:hypothetical protein
VNARRLTLPLGARARHPSSRDSDLRGWAFKGCAATAPCCCSDIDGGPGCAFSDCYGAYNSGSIVTCPAGDGAGTSPQFSIPVGSGGAGATTTIYVTAYGLCSDTGARARVCGCMCAEGGGVGAADGVALAHAVRACA